MSMQQRSAKFRSTSTLNNPFSPRKSRQSEYGRNSIIFNETGQDEIQHFPTDFLGTRKRHREAWKQLNCDQYVNLFIDGFFVTVYPAHAMKNGLTKTKLTEPFARPTP
ncbi:hypothetical protein B0H13DRAFT_1931184 [Mycena leptocephala]|nr:hypothetical protein B0H13DRAFT_1931184 [Mycena leptocephala]